MTLEEIRIAIATQQGYSNFEFREEWEDDGDGCDEVTVLRANLGDSTHCRVPNYPEDLNAIQRAIKTLDRNGRCDFAFWLGQIFEKCDEHTSLEEVCDYITATPLQWCQAYVNTIQELPTPRMEASPKPPA